MPRTVTGTYILRPTSQRTYRSSGTFSDWFSTSNSSPSGGWTSNLGISGSEIGDGSDSTYHNWGTPSTSQIGKNSILNLTPANVSDVPNVDYTITGVKIYYRTKSSAAHSTSKVCNIWSTIYDSGGYKTNSPDARRDAGSFTWFWCVDGTSTQVVTNSIVTYNASTTVSSNNSMAAGDYPDLMALCIECYRGNWTHTTYTYMYLYDIWYEITYSYTEYEKSVQYRNDEGVVVTVNGLALDAIATYQDYKGVAYPLVAAVQPGYILDGYYLNGQKVSSSENYTFTFSNDSDELYCITKKRKIFVGDYQVDEVYIGTTPVTEIYDGDTCIWGLSDLYGDATAVG